MVCGAIHSCDVVSCNVCILYLLMPKGVQSIININYVKRNLLWAKLSYLPFFVSFSFLSNFFSWDILVFDDRSIWIQKISTFSWEGRDGRRKQQQNSEWHGEKIPQQKEKE